MDKEKFLDRLGQILDRQWLTNNGPMVQEFEGRLAKYLRVRHCVVTCNATVGLEIAARALGLSGEVIVPAFTFVATAHAIRWLGMKPVFCDVDADTHNLDPGKVEELITPRTTAILGVHLWGRPCSVERLAELAREHGLRLFFDAAHAFACSYKGRRVGGFGDCEVFSFHATKFLHSFEGGAVTTEDGELAERLRLMRNFGFAGYDSVVALGTNGKMTEPCAAMGLTNLEEIETLLTANREHFRRYRDALEGLPGLRLLGPGEREEWNHQYVVLEVEPANGRFSRDRLLSHLHEHRVLARRYFHPGMHRMEPYLSEEQSGRENLANAERLAERVLVLPTGAALSTSDVDRVCGLIGDFVTS